MNPTSKESNARSLAKTITWRLVGSLDTFFLSWLLSGQTTKASSIALLDTAIKLVVYYLHERVWQRIPLGYFRSLRKGKQVSTASLKNESHLRSITKSLSWRIIGGLITVLLAYIILDDPKMAWSIGGIEFVSKFILFYIHERLWQLIPRGQFRKLIKRK